MQLIYTLWGQEYIHTAISTNSPQVKPTSYLYIYMFNKFISILLKSIDINQCSKN